MLGIGWISQDFQNQGPPREVEHLLGGCVDSALRQLGPAASPSTKLGRRALHPRAGINGHIVRPRNHDWRWPALSGQYGHYAGLADDGGRERSQGGSVQSGLCD